jgi:hypothetical protein
VRQCREIIARETRWLGFSIGLPVLSYESQHFKVGKALNQSQQSFFLPFSFDLIAHYIEYKIGKNSCRATLFTYSLTSPQRCARIPHSLNMAALAATALWVVCAEEA